MDRSALKANYHKCAFSVWGRRVTPAVFGPQVYPGPIVCVLKDGLLSMTNGPSLLVCHWMGYTVICDTSSTEFAATVQGTTLPDAALVERTAFAARTVLKCGIRVAQEASAARSP